VPLCVPLLGIELILTGWLPIVTLLRRVGGRCFPLGAVTVVAEANIHGAGIAPVALLPGADEEAGSELANLSELEYPVGLLMLEGA